MENQNQQSQTPIQELVEPTVLVQNPTQKNPVIPVLLVILLLLLTSTAFLAYQNFQLQKQISLLTSNQPISQSTTQPSPTADPTANWKTYTNPTNAYSFKYPEGLSSNNSGGGTGFEEIHFTFIGPVQTASGKTQTELSDGYRFDVIKLGLIDPKTEVNKAVENSKQICTSVSTVSSVVVAGTDAFQYSGNCLGMTTTTYLSDGKNTYAVTQTYTSDAYKKTTNQILSTFKFLGQNSNQSLKTYTNSSYGLSFDYPSSWAIEENWGSSGFANFHYIVLVKNSNINYGPEPGAFGVTVYDNPKNLTLQEFENENQTATGSIGVYDPNAKSVSLGNLSSQYSIDANCEPVLCSRYVVATKSKIFFISIYKDAIKNDVATVNQILSTFKFTQ